MCKPVERDFDLTHLNTNHIHWNVQDPFELLRGMNPDKMVTLRIGLRGEQDTRRACMNVRAASLLLRDARIVYAQVLS